MNVPKTITGIAILMTAALAAQSPEQAKAELMDASGKTIGTATLTDTPHGVLIHLNLTAAPPGVHAFHVHTTGTCEAPFTSAGEHFNPAKKQHGIQNMNGMHAGDLPNFTVPASGMLQIDLLAESITLKAGANTVLDADGSALVLHATGDDYRTDPAGNAGDRIACGVVAR